MSLLARFAAGALALGAVLGAPGAARTNAAETMGWSPPAQLGSCTANGAPQVVFPSDAPDHATGPGAIVWSAAPSCAGGEGARVARVGVADVPTPPAVPAVGHARLVPFGALAVSAGPRGRIVIAGESPQIGSSALVIQGRATGPFSQLWSTHGNSTPLALSSGYLGDVALASPPAVGADSAGLRVGVERFFAHELAVRAPASTWGTRSADAVTVALDYRSDALAVWAQAGSLWAHDLPATGTSQSVQRLAPAAGDVDISALLSDDNRGTVAWAQESGGVTSVYLDRSAGGVRFGAARLLERFKDPDGLPNPAGSPRLVRLSSESVMMAWAGSAAGHWVVHTAAIDFNGLGAASTIAAPGGGDALLADLAPGPFGEAMLLWTEPQTAEPQSAAGAPQQAIFAAHGTDVRPDATAFGTPEQIAPAGPYSDVTGALDPASNRALVAWRAEGGTLQYAIRSPSGDGR